MLDPHFQTNHVSLNWKFHVCIYLKYTLSSSHIDDI